MAKYLSILLCVLMIESIAVAQYSPELSVKGEKFSSADLKKLITQNNITSIEELLPRLPKQYLEAYTLAYASRSLQGASFSNPRAILYGEDATLVMTFNGSAAQNNFNNLEVMEFDKDKKVFTFQDIEFLKGAPAKFSKLNPESCLKCHGQDPKPIWDSYPLWPGFYGSSDDKMTVQAEQLNYMSYVRSSYSHPRYRHLKDFEKTGSRNLNFTHLLGRLNLARISKKITDNKLLYPFRYYMIAAGLSCYNDFASSDMDLQIPQKIRTEEFNTASFKSMMPDLFQTRLQVFNRAASDLKISRSQYLLQADSRLNYEAQKGGDMYFNKSYVPNLSAFLFADPFNLTDYKNWSMASFPSASMDVHYGYYGINALGFYLANDWLSAKDDVDVFKPIIDIFQKWQSTSLDKELSFYENERIPFVFSWANYYKDTVCKSLREKNATSLSTLPENYFQSTRTKFKEDQLAADLNLTNKLNKLFKTCQACHTSPVEGVRQIPFDSIDKLKHELSAGTYVDGSLLNAVKNRFASEGDDHMPKFGFLNKEDKKKMVDFLEQLQKESLQP